MAVVRYVSQLESQGAQAVGRRHHNARTTTKLRILTRDRGHSIACIIMVSFWSCLTHNSACPGCAHFPQGALAKTSQRANDDETANSDQGSRSQHRRHYNGVILELPDSQQRVPRLCTFCGWKRESRALRAIIGRFAQI